MIKNYTQFIKESKVDDNIKDYNSMIDYTLLESNATEEDILNLTEKARIIVPKSICILPNMVSFAKEHLRDTEISVCTVISFPEGTNSLEDKISETKKALEDGADEIDMVLNYKRLIEQWNTETLSTDKGTHEYLLNEIKKVSTICHVDNKILKVIVESGRLDIPQTKYVTTLCIDGDADFIKTSTGKIEIGAELDKVKSMEEIITEEGSDLQIKVSAGIRTIEDIEKFYPFVDRFGIGWSSVDKINGLTSNNKTDY